MVVALWLVKNDRGEEGWGLWLLKNDRDDSGEKRGGGCGY
jgi:hypothetical protein